MDANAIYGQLMAMQPGCFLDFNLTDRASVTSALGRAREKRLEAGRSYWTMQQDDSIKSCIRIKCFEESSILCPRLLANRARGEEALPVNA